MPDTNGLVTLHAPEDLMEALDRAAARERVLLTRDRKPAVALVSIDDLAILEAIEDRADTLDYLARLGEWRAEAATGQSGDFPPTVSLEELAARDGVNLVNAE